jgi:hypothetical protein
MGVGSRFHFLRARTCFRNYRKRRVPFSCFARPDSISAIPRASGHVFMFCAPDSFSAETRVPGAVFMFCAPRIISRGTASISSRFHVLRALTRFGSRFHVLRSTSRFSRYRGRRVPFSCFARSNMFSAILRVLVPFSCFALPNMFFAVPSASGPVLMFCAPGLISGGLEDDGLRFHVLRAGNSFCQYRVHRVPFSCFALVDTFLAAAQRALFPDFMF